MYNLAGAILALAGDGLVWGVPLALMALVMFAGVLTLAKHARTVNAAFSELARRAGGSAALGRLRYPRARIPVGDTEALIRGAFASQYSSEYAEVDIPPSTPLPGRMSVVSKGFYAPFLIGRGAERLVTGDRSFDGEFVVAATHRDFVDALLDAQGRKALMRLGEVLGPAPTVLVVHPTSLTLRKYGVYDRSECLEDLLDATRTLFEKAEALSQGRIDIRLIEPGIEESAGACPVCGDELAKSVVWCRTCGTPHHKDCWKFNQGCAKFACGGKKYGRKRIG